MHRMEAVRYEVLTDADVARLHDAALRVLAEVGVRVTTSEARALLSGVGAAVDGETVRVPPDVVERALASAPSRFEVFDRGGAPALRLGEGEVYAGAGVTNLNYLDPRSGEIGDFTLAATGETARLVDALPHVDFLATPGVTRAAPDLPQHVVNQCEFVEMVSNTTKPLMVLVAGAVELEDVADMASTVAGGPEAFRARPFVVAYLNSVSPLVFNRETLEKLTIAVDRGMPVCCQAAPQVGGTGPATLAGTLVVAAAETLLGLTLTQLRAPGAPFISGTVPFLMDMRSGAVTAGGPDGFRAMAAMAQLCRRWGLPSVGMTLGGDAKLADEQAALEVAYYGLGTALGGVDLVFDAGCLEGGLLFSPEVLVIADEVADMARRAVTPVEVSDETIAFDTIAAVGPGGQYLGERHTRRHFRELWLPTTLSWEPRAAWDGTTLGQRARARALEILDSHEPERLSDATASRLREIVDARRAAGPPA
ncbi:MAG TPA: trimethylamine methyltransferase family protein [Actinomycetota bacterium]